MSREQVFDRRPNGLGGCGTGDGVRLEPDRRKGVTRARRVGWIVTCDADQRRSALQGGPRDLGHAGDDVGEAACAGDAPQVARLLDVRRAARLIGLAGVRAGNRRDEPHGAEPVERRVIVHGLRLAAVLASTHAAISACGGRAASLVRRRARGHAFKLAGRIRVAPADLAAWMEANRVRTRRSPEVPAITPSGPGPHPLGLRTLAARSNEESS